MKNLTVLIFILVLGIAARGATPARPSTQSFAELLKMLSAQEELELLAQRMDTQLDISFQRVMGSHATPEGQAFGEAYRQKVQDNFHREITLEILAGAFLKDAGKHWTQEEVDALLALGTTPTGRTALAKLVGSYRAVAATAQEHFVKFRTEPAQSVADAVKQLTEINNKALAAQQPPTATTVATPPAQPEPVKVK